MVYLVGPRRKRWRVALFGWLRAERSGQVVTQFRTRKTALLFAYLALHSERPHPREVLIELLWPGVAPEAGRRSLSVALSSLRAQFDAGDGGSGSVLAADRATVRVRDEAVTTDVAEFLEAIGAAQSVSGDARIPLLERAATLYAGELLPGYYDDWVLAERERLEGAHLEALSALSALYVAAGDRAKALGALARAIAVAPYREDLYRDAIRLRLASRQPAAALELFSRLERALDEGLGVAPEPETRALVEGLAGSHAESRPRDAARIAPAAGRSKASTAPSRATAVPRYFDEFVGRLAEIDRLEALLVEEHARLVTLVGPGGIGKTRLAVEAVGRLATATARSVSFASLADVPDGGGLAEALLRAVGAMPAQGRIDPLDQLAAALSGRPALVVVDNAEHVADDLAPIVGELLARTTAAFLVTSRRRLGVGGERVVPLDPLAVIDGGSDDERAAEAESVRLFANRAALALPGFRLTPENLSAVVELCAQLEGIPLALELAAARSAVLTPGEMVQRMGERLTLFARRHDGTSPRHETLLAAVGWSYHLLPPELKRLFRRLAVFRGGWTAEAAELVCGDRHVLDGLDRLADWSLVRPETVGGGVRFRMLDTLRAYAAARLGAREGEATARAHARYYLSLADRAEPELVGPKQREWLDRLAAEHENFRVALAWSCEREPGAPTALGLVKALFRFWHFRGHYAEGRAWTRRVLAVTDGATAVRATALRAAGALAFYQSDLDESVCFYEASLAICREIDDRVGVANALGNLGSVRKDQGRYAEARELLEAGLAANRELEDRWKIASGLNNLGTMNIACGNFETAREQLREAIAIWRDLGDQISVSMALYNLADLVAIVSGPAAAFPLYEESLALQRDAGHVGGVAETLRTLGRASCLMGDYERAAGLLEESVRLWIELADSEGIAHVFEAYSMLALARGDPRLGARLVGAASALREGIGAPAPAAERAESLKREAALRSALGAGVYASEREVGRALEWRKMAEEVLTASSRGTRASRHRSSG